MSAITEAGGATASSGPRPVGAVNVFDPHPLNWLFITWNTMEEPIRTDPDGYIVMALAESAEWRDELNLEIKVREGATFQDGEPVTAHSIKQNFDEVQRWAAPHPPGTYLNFHPDAECIVESDLVCVFKLPEPDGLILGKFRGFHIASSAFWKEYGFGYQRIGTGEGHW